MTLYPREDRLEAAEYAIKNQRYVFENKHSGSLAVTSSGDEVAVLKENTTRYFLVYDPWARESVRDAMALALRAGL